MLKVLQSITPRDQTRTEQVLSFKKNLYIAIHSNTYFSVFCQKRLKTETEAAFNTTELTNVYSMLSYTASVWHRSFQITMTQRTKYANHLFTSPKSLQGRIGPRISHDI